MNNHKTQDLALAISHAANAVEDLAFLIDKDRDPKVVKARAEQARQNLSEAQRRLDALIYGRVAEASGRRRSQDPVKML